MGTHGWVLEESNPPIYLYRGDTGYMRGRDSKWVVNFLLNPPNGYLLVIITHLWVPQSGGYPPHPVGRFAA
jgi:hypothetical protein